MGDLRNVQSTWLKGNQNNEYNVSLPLFNYYGQKNEIYPVNQVVCACAKPQNIKLKLHSVKHSIAYRQVIFSIRVFCKKQVLHTTRRQT